MLQTILQYNFLQHALVSAVLASIVCGIVGTIIVEKKMVMLSGGIAHTSFGGIGMGYFLGIEPIFGGLVFAVLAALGIATIRKNTETAVDSLIGIFWAVGMAIGILFISLTPGYPPDMSSYLFGDILTVSQTDLVMMAIITLVVSITIIILFNYIKAYLFDEQFAALRGINVKTIDFLLFLLIALTIVVLIRVVGIILVIALLTAPPAIARFFTSNLINLMITAICLGTVFCLSGLALSYYFNLASGATIIMLAGSVYFAVVLLNRVDILKQTNKRSLVKSEQH